MISWQQLLQICVLILSFYFSVLSSNLVLCCPRKKKKKRKRKTQKNKQTKWEPLWTFYLIIVMLESPVTISCTIIQLPQGLPALFHDIILFDPKNSLCTLIQACMQNQIKTTQRSCDMLGNAHHFFSVFFSNTTQFLFYRLFRNITFLPLLRWRHHIFCTMWRFSIGIIQKFWLQALL